MQHVQRAGRVTVIGLWMALMIGCSPFGLVDNADASTDMLDPEVIKNQQGVLALYNSSVLGLANVMAGSKKTPTGVDEIGTPSFVRLVGHVSDEMDYRTTSAPVVSTETYPQLDISTRNFDPDPNATTKNFFNRLSNLRILAAETQAGFRVYGALLSDTILAHAMAIEASALIMTAELYCSGVPLSTLEYNGDIRMTRGYSTDEVYTFALAKLDTASTLSQESARISSFINVLRIRVLLGMGRIQEAADRAGDVETSFLYQISYPKVATINPNGLVGSYYGKFTVANTPSSTQQDGVERISDRKGSNGLPYVSSNDPRVNLPALSDPWAPLVMASGLEARLAEAEAALKRDDPSWLTILNQLRTSCTSHDACPTPAPAGSGGVSGLGLLEDTGTAEAQLALLFEERAYWLFLRGFRQGDLRRRIRVYGGSAQELYPIGFPEVGNVAYGYMVAMPIPLAEQRYNPNYNGCLNNDA